MPQGRDESGEGKGIRLRNGEIRVSVYSDADPAPEQILPEIIPVRIGRAGRVIYGSVKRDAHTRKESLREFVRVEGPPGSSGKRKTVQRNAGQRGAELTP